MERYHRMRTFAGSSVPGAARRAILQVRQLRWATTREKTRRLRLNPLSSSGRIKAYEVFIRYLEGIPSDRKNFVWSGPISRSGV